MVDIGKTEGLNFPETEISQYIIIYIFESTINFKWVNIDRNLNFLRYLYLVSNVLKDAQIYIVGSNI